MSDVRGSAIDENKQSKNPLLKWMPLLLFCTAAGLLATLWGYNYTDGNAEEQLPFIFRAMDQSFLARDFFTNTYSIYGPRTIFSEFVGFFASFIPLTVVLFLLTLLANIAIAVISALISGYFFPDSKFSMFLAAAGVLTLKTFWLGYSNIIFRNFLEPEHLAMPLLLLGFWLILKRKFVFAAFSFGVAALFHALLGLELGWILIGLSLLESAIQRLRKERQQPGFRSQLFGCLILVIFSIGLLYPYILQESIPASEFINLVAYVRHPHHYLPSTFESWQWAQAAVYLLGFGFIFWQVLHRSESLRLHKRYLLMIGGLITLLCLGGYLFVEVWPSRLWTSAQMFRLPYFIKWFSIVIVTGWAGYLIEKPVVQRSRLFGLTAGIGLVTPASLAFVSIADWVRCKFLSRLKIPAWLTNDVVLFGLTLAVVIIYRPELRTWFLFLLFFGAIWIMYLLRWRLSGLLFSTSSILAVAVLFFLFSNTLTPPSFLKYEVPVFSLYKTNGELADIANFAKTNTPSDALFLTPPKFGEFRYMANRAIVVDFVAYPFQDLSMQEWYQRMANCYGVADKQGFDAIWQLNQNVYFYTDDQILKLSEKYGFEYAIVYDSTVTNFPILFRTTSLKLIQVTN